MEIRILRYFLAVAEEQSFSRAAERLHLSQPALSQQLGAYEDEIGARLFVRSPKRIELTDKGRMLLRRARDIVELAARTERASRRMATEIFPAPLSSARERWRPSGVWQGR